VVVANTGQRFVTEKEAVLAPSGYATVPIVALAPGADSNLPPGAIDHLEDPQHTEMRVENRQAAWGGTDRPVSVATEEDRAALREALSEQAAAEAPGRLTGLGGSDYIVLPETISTTLDEHYDYAAGQETTSLWGGATVRAQVMALPQRAVTDVAVRAWQEQLPAELASAETPRVTGEPKVVEQGEEQLVVAVPVEGKVAPSLDADTLAAELRGQSSETI
jgi:hypothetical protein